MHGNWVCRANWLHRDKKNFSVCATENIIIITKKQQKDNMLYNAKHDLLKLEVLQVYKNDL